MGGSLFKSSPRQRVSNHLQIVNQQFMSADPDFQTQPGHSMLVHNNHLNKVVDLGRSISINGEQDLPWGAAGQEHRDKASQN